MPSALHLWELEEPESPDILDKKDLPLQQRMLLKREIERAAQWPRLGRLDVAHSAAEHQVPWAVWPTPSSLETCLSGLTGEEKQVHSREDVAKQPERERQRQVRQNI